MRIALYEPDIPQNTGALLRLAACLGVALDIIEPCGFALSDRRLKRAGLDYAERASFAMHSSFDAFIEKHSTDRVILLTTRAQQAHIDFAFEPEDILLLGRESAGVPQTVHARIAHKICIPMQPGLRSLNVALAGAIVLAEALRQTQQFPACGR